MAVVYQPPPGGLYVTNPRTVVDIVARSLAIHCFAVCAYAQLKSLAPWTTDRQLSIVQMVLFLLFPELAVMQAPFYVLFVLLAGRESPDRVVHKPHADPSGKNPNHRRRDSNGPDTPKVDNSTAATAVETDSEKQFDHASKRAVPSRSHLLFAITTSAPLVATILAYKQRLALTYMAADYVGNLGLDHRNGWIAIGGMVAATGSVVLLFLKRPSASKVVSPEAPVPFLERESFAPDLILGQAGVCSMIHHVLLAATNHITPLSYINHLGRGPLLALLCAGLVVYWRRPKWRALYTVAVRCLVVLFVATTAGTQLFSDINELLDVSVDRVLPYNYRWKVKDWVSGSIAT
ncbi:hypothetical protein MMC32_003906 [Xylographa parallela]|nr:hypothetical protein [Xylographa parallela]